MSVNFDDMGQIAFANYLQTMAATFYDENHQPYPEALIKLDFRKIGELDYGKTSIDSDTFPEVNQWLASKSIVQYAHIKRSGTATVLAAKTETGQHAVIRVPRSYNPKDHMRLSHPAILQPFPGATLPYESGNIEILPFVKMVELFKDGEYNQVNWSLRDGLPYLVSMYDRAGFNHSTIKNDLSVLPDGTPVVVDPDILSFKDIPPSAEEITQRQQRILMKYPYLRPVSWIKDGKPAQDRFFGADYLTSVPSLKPGFVLDESRSVVRPPLGSPP